MTKVSVPSPQQNIAATAYILMTITGSNQAQGKVKTVPMRSLMWWIDEKLGAIVSYTIHIFPSETVALLDKLFLGIRLL